MNEATAQSLMAKFGYVPNEAEGEQWTVYQNNTLIVIHFERRPRVFTLGCGGTYFEIEPNFGRFP